jgi:hypothetical protein
VLKRLEIRKNQLKPPNIYLLVLLSNNFSIYTRTIFTSLVHCEREREKREKRENAEREGFEREREREDNGADLRQVS